MPWQAAESGTIAQDGQGAFHVKVAGQWISAPKGSIAKDSQDIYHLNSDAIGSREPVAPPESHPVMDVVKGVGDAALSGASKVATGIVGAPIALANRLVAAATGGNPQMAADTAHEYVNKTFGHDTTTPIGQAIGGAVSGALAPIGQSLNTLGNAAEQGGEKIGIPRGETHGAISELSDIAGTAPLAAGARAGAAASDQAATLAAQNVPTAVAKYGMRTAENSPIARNIAGSSGHEALALHNQPLGNIVLGAEAGLPHGTRLNYDTLAAGQNAPNAVYGRVAAALPEGPLSPAAQAQVNAAGGVGNRITAGSPDALNHIGALKGSLLEPGKTFTGNQIVNEMRGLRQEGYVNVGSDDVSKQQLGKAQLDMARGLEQHVSDTLPATADTSMEQLQAARTALAKNHAVQAALHGPDVDMQAIARIQRADPQLLSGGMQDIADFANAHPEVSSLPTKGARYNPPGVMKDIGNVDIIHPSTWAKPLVGGFARRALTGNPEAATAAARSAPVSGLGGEFAPIDRGPPQPPPEMTASTPSAPPPAAGPRPGDIPLADLLSHGVEQGPPAGLSLAPDVSRGAPGLTFRNDPGFNAGELSLADEIAPRGAAPNNTDLGAVMSQGVPEGIMQRAPSSRTKGTMQTIDFPSGVEHPSFQNNASGESAASMEAQSRLRQEKAAGTRPVVVGPSGDEQPLLHDVTAVDRNPPKGAIIIDAKTGKLISSGNLKPNAAQALLRQWQARRSRPLGEAFGG